MSMPLNTYKYDVVVVHFSYFSLICAHTRSVYVCMHAHTYVYVCVCVCCVCAYLCSCIHVCVVTVVHV